MNACLPAALRGDGTCASTIGDEIHALASELYPIGRSITGPGVRLTLDILSRHIDIQRQWIASGEPIFDWIVPPEWSIREAYIRDPDGRTVVDFAQSNLHVVGYSAPVRRVMPLSELRAHIFTLPDQPDLIPYRTAYYTPTWGFCMTHRQLEALPEGDYQVCIDSTFKDCGRLDYGEYLHRGASDREVLMTAHICHPSLANDNCSGLALLTLLARNLSSRWTRYSYRFLFAPGTVGSLSWLARNESRVGLVENGLVVSCVGDGGGPTYKRSRCGNATIDRAMTHVLSRPEWAGTVKDFSPYGYDERQFCSPGFDMPVGLLQNSAFGTFPEYHTSADDLDFIRPEYLGRTYRLIMEVIDILEGDWTPISLSPKGEPQLGRRGLYAALGGDKAGGEAAMAMLWVLNLSDGAHSLLSMAERSGMAFADIAMAARLLREHDLLADIEERLSSETPLMRRPAQVPASRDPALT